MGTTQSKNKDKKDKRRDAAVEQVPATNSIVAEDSPIENYHFFDTQTGVEIVAEVDGGGDGDGNVDTGAGGNEGGNETGAGGNEDGNDTEGSSKLQMYILLRK